MIPTKSILKFFGLFLAVYIALMVFSSLTGIHHAYRSVFANYCTSWYNTFGNSEILFQFESKPKVGHDALDLGIYFVNHEMLAAAKEDAKRKGIKEYSARRAEWGLNSWLFGFLPSLFLTSLILVSPISWRRKGIAFIVGLIVFHFYLTLRLHLEFSEQISLHDWLSTKSGEGGFTKFVKRFLYIEFNYIMAFLVWIAVTFRKADFDGWMKALQLKA
ncbi:MAG: hypothetical protein AAF502_05210 [Bacteroidota bacterium]